MHLYVCEHIYANKVEKFREWFEPSPPQTVKVWTSPLATPPASSNRKYSDAESWPCVFKGPLLYQALWQISLSCKSCRALPWEDFSEKVFPQQHYWTSERKINCAVNIPAGCKFHGQNGHTLPSALASVHNQSVLATVEDREACKVFTWRTPVGVLPTPAKSSVPHGARTSCELVTVRSNSCWAGGCTVFLQSRNSVVPAAPPGGSG